VKRAAQAGLTLLEMMVVLMIAAMALAIGFQSLGQWRQADAAISSVGSRLQRYSLTREWFQASVRGLYPIAEQAFSGESQRLAGMTLQPVVATQGGLTEVEWEISREAATGLQLSVREGGQSLDLPLENTREAGFLYLDSEGKTHRQWPPALGLHENLPAAVVLQLTSEDGEQRLWSARIIGIRNPVPNFYEAQPD
jgi:general secretion pathway protein J